MVRIPRMGKYTIEGTRDISCISASEVFFTNLLELLNPYLPMLFIVNAVRSMLAGTCFYLAWKLVRDMPASRGDPLRAVPV